MAANGSADDATATPPAPAAGPARRFRARAELRGVPAAVWALTGLQLVVLVAYSVLMPTYRAPDEPQNFDITLAAMRLTVFPGEHREMSPSVLRSYPHAGFSMDARKQPVSPTPPTPREQRPSLAELATSGDDYDTAPNQQWQHPPLYPASLAAALTVTGALLPGTTVWAFDQTLGLARLLNALLIAPLPLLAYLTARRLTGRQTVAVAAAIVPLTVPQLAHIGSAVNHDNLLVALVGVATVLVAFVVRGDRSWQTASALGVVGGLALLTKGFGLFIPAWIAAAYLLSGLRTRDWHVLRSGLGGMVLTAGVGGWWWLRNLAVYGTVQPTGVDLPLPETGFVADLGWWLGWSARMIVWRFWGNFGWFQAPLPPWVPAVAGAAAVVAVAAALRRRQCCGLRLADLFAMAFPTAAIAGVVAYGGWEYYVSSGHALGIQGRYLFPGVVGAGVVVGVGVAALLGQRERWAPAGLLGAAGLLHLLAVHSILRGVWGAGVRLSWQEALVAVVRWSPWPAGALAIGLAGLVAMLTVTVGSLTPTAQPGRHAASSKAIR